MRWRSGKRGAMSASASNATPGAAPSGAVALRAPAFRAGVRPSVRALTTRAPRAELMALVLLAAALNMWALSRNGFANEYYSAAVRSMSTSWHNFLYASLDKTGLMTVDKPPLALWIQALSVRLFGYHSLSLLVPQALEGVASVVLTYDLVRRRFGRLGGTVAGAALALTPMTVAISRHNNPDALLVLCCVAAVWFTVRALEDGRTRWIVLAGVAAGLGFETKMLVALAVVPGIVAAWMWMAPAARGTARALRGLAAGGAAMLSLGGAWPLLVELTPASDRPWVSGTRDNTILSLIFGYNGVGRIEGQTGGPAGGGGGTFGGTPGPLRLLNLSLGGQAGWLLGLALVSGLGLVVATRLRRADARSGWLLAVGGAALTSGLLFSFASGIFHPYYVSLLAPFVAALAGAGVAQIFSSGERAGAARGALALGALAVAAGIACELVVLNDYPGELEWLAPLLLAVGAVSTVALAMRGRMRRRAALVAATLAMLLGPAIWSVDTVGYATSGTFPAGGPQSAQFSGGPAGGLGGGALFGFGGFAPRSGGAGAPLFGSPPAGPPQAAGTGPGAPQAAGAGEGGGFAPPARLRAGAGAFGGFGGGFGSRSGAFGGEELKSVLAYISSHGGGTLAVASQSSAASAIISEDANVAGIGGFSGRESSVSVSWLAQRVRSGAVRWVLAEGTGAGPRLPGDTRAGSRKALNAVARACRAVHVPAGGGASSSGGGGEGSATTVYDCAGRAGALTAAA